jgi:tetratricopeptide (TPR) repeat protein
MLFPRSLFLFWATILVLVFVAPVISQAQLSELDQIQIAPPVSQVQPPSKDASAEQLEKQGDELRAEKAYLDALDYFRAALAKQPDNPPVLNKIGIIDLMLQRYREAGKDFEQALKKDRKFAEAYNNLGVVKYELGAQGLRHKHLFAGRDLSRAIADYKKAIELDPNSASFYSNMGAAYFAEQKIEEASRAYEEAIRLDPQIFERNSHTGIAAQMSSPEDRAHYDYVLAKLYAKMGDTDHSLQYLREAMENGYRAVNNALTDPEFADLRKDARFTDLMKARPVAIPE